MLKSIQTNPISSDQLPHVISGDPLFQQIFRHLYWIKFKMALLPFLPLLTFA